MVNEYHFSDGAIAPYSHLVTEAGAMYVTPSLNARVFENLKIVIAQQRLSRKKDLIDEGDKTESIACRFTIPPYEILMFGLLNCAQLYLCSGTVEFISNLEGVENQTGKQFAKYFLDHFYTRTLYELPKQPGVCFPYGFIADDGKASRDISLR